MEQRRAFLAKLLGDQRAAELWERMPQYLTKGSLCHRCKKIADALTVANGGDFHRVLMHVQVERFYCARRYRQGVVTIEPQLHVDAQYQQLTYNKSIGSLPASLQNINLFALTGDLVDGNRGLIEFSDLLKRPVDTFKYLLGACETGAVNVGSAIAHLDTVMIGSTNEVQLDAFKEFPDFTSFKARIELVRVPYLMGVAQEREIYQPLLTQLADRKTRRPARGLDRGALGGAHPPQEAELHQLSAQRLDDHLKSNATRESQALRRRRNPRREFRPRIVKCCVRACASYARNISTSLITKAAWAPPRAR